MQGERADTRLALCELRVRGRARLRRHPVYKGTEHSDGSRFGQTRLRDSLSVAEIDKAKQTVLERNNQKEAYVRPLIAWRGSEQLGVSAQQKQDLTSRSRPGNGRAISIAVQPVKDVKLDLADTVGPIPRPRLLPAEAARPHMIRTRLQDAPSRAATSRRDDARPAGPRRRMHRRQHLLRQGRQDPTAPTAIASSPASPAPPPSCWPRNAASR